jgi:hypothetical protein
MRITVEFNKRDLELVRGFLYNSYANFHQGIYGVTPTEAEERKCLKELERIRAAFQPIMDIN